MANLTLQLHPNLIIARHVCGMTFQKHLELQVMKNDDEHARVVATGKSNLE